MASVADDHAEPGAHRSLQLGLLLAVVGGFLDAFTYVGHGHVFANTMSGNVVVAGVSVVAGHWTQAIRSLTVVPAFLAGVATANLMHLPRVSAVVRQPKLDCLFLELAFLLIVGGLPAGYPDLVTTLGISFVAAVQTSTFRHQGDWPYSSVMITGNLRSFADAAVAWLSFRGQAEAHKLVHFGTVCSAFLAGALLGAACTSQWGNRAAWPAALLIGAAVLLLSFNARSTTDSGESHRSQAERHESETPGQATPATREAAHEMTGAPGPGAPYQQRPLAGPAVCPGPAPECLALLAFGSDQS